MAGKPFLFWQTSDASVYKPMLDLTADQNKFYCDLNDIKYESFVGLARGYWPWQATFNRIVKLKQLLDQGFDGWFIYADADSYVFDLNFKLKSFLQGLDGIFFVAATGGDSRRLAVNAGVFFIDLSMAQAAWVVEQWHEAFTGVATDDYLRRQETWGDDGINDQELLHRVIGKRHRELDAHIMVDDGHLINYRGTFIRQVLRTTFKEFDRRMEAIREDIALSRRSFYGPGG